jgi:hypothetical protein
MNRVRQCSIDELLPKLAALITPVLRPEEKVYACFERAGLVNGEMNYVAIIMTEYYLHEVSGSEDPEEGAIRLSIKLRRIGAITRSQSPDGFRVSIHEAGSDNRDDIYFDFLTLGDADVFEKNIKELQSLALRAS